MPYAFGTGYIKKHNYEVYMRATGEKYHTSDNTKGTLLTTKTAFETTADEQLQTFTHIGGCDEKPFVENQDGDTKKINSGKELELSENVVVEFSDLEVSPGNYGALRTLAGNNVDILFYDSDSGQAIFIWDIKVKAKIKASGNDFNIVKVSGKQEVTDFDNSVYFLELSD